MKKDQSCYFRLFGKTTKINNFTGVDTYIHIGARSNGTMWNWLWPQSALNFTNWPKHETLSGAGEKRCAYMNVNTGLWAPQDCGVGTAFVCEKVIGEELCC